MPDLRRREPQNVGVVLFVDGDPYYRFRGQRPDGTVDGRRVRWARDVQMYRAWVEHWQRAAASGDRSRLVAASHSDHSFFLEEGGERLVGPGAIAAHDLLDELYIALVEHGPAQA